MKIPAAVAVALITLIFSLQTCIADNTASISVTVTPVQPSGSIDELNKTNSQKAWIDEDAFEIEIFHLLQIAISSMLFMIGFYMIKRKITSYTPHSQKSGINPSCSH